MDKQPLPLSSEDEFHLRAVSGWAGLGDFVSAREELTYFSPQMRQHPAVMLAESELLFAEQKWEELLPLVAELVRLFPEHDFLWINRSYALHELKRTREALNFLLPAAEKFSGIWLIRYNLACYCAQLGESADALRWLLKAASLGDKQTVKSMALEDPDLAPLREAIEKI